MVKRIDEEGVRRGGKWRRGGEGGRREGGEEYTKMKRRYRKINYGKE